MVSSVRHYALVMVATLEYSQMDLLRHEGIILIPVLLFFVVSHSWQ